MDTLGKIISGIVMMIIGIVIGGFIFMKTWIWFIVPVFPSLPVLTLGQSIGISVFITLLTAKLDEKDREFNEITERFFMGLIYAGLLLLVAWLVFLCIR